MLRILMLVIVFAWCYPWMASAQYHPIRSSKRGTRPRATSYYQPSFHQDPSTVHSAMPKQELRLPAPTAVQPSRPILPAPTPVRPKQPAAAPPDYSGSMPSPLRKSNPFALPSQQRNLSPNPAENAAPNGMFEDGSTVILPPVPAEIASQEDLARTFTQAPSPYAALNQASVCEPCNVDCCPCPPPGRVWLSGEWLYWTTLGARTPALVTTSSPGTPRTQAGVLGLPTTSILYGDTRINDDFQSGFRVVGGVWLDDCGKLGVDGGFFFLDDQMDQFSATSTGTPILARPFSNAATNLADAQLIAFGGVPDAQLVAFPGVVSGSVEVDSDLSLYGFDANLRGNLWCGCAYRVDGLLGYRYANLDESLQIRENLLVGAGSPGITPGTNFMVMDRFATDNDFHGGQVGLNSRVQVTPCSWFDLTGKVAFGNVTRRVAIDGQTTVIPPGGPATNLVGGLLAQPTNIGRFEANEFAVIPELTAKIGFQLARRLRAFVAYNFLYISNVVRPGDQIDTVVNASQIPPGPLVGEARPAVLNADADFWAQGVSIGMEFWY